MKPEGDIQALAADRMALLSEKITGEPVISSRLNKLMT
jgi:hypothetical protein